MLTLQEPPQMIARLWSPALDHRLTAATDSLRRAREKELGANIRFLAAGALAGRLVKGVPLGQAELDRICRLPVDVLQHDPGAEGVDDWRQQLWMGLRFLASQSPGTMVVDLSAIQCTLVRWQVNHETTSIDPSTTAHWINKSMVRWLTACLANGTGKLLSDHEPLWLLTGFPQNPSEIR